MKYTLFHDFCAIKYISRFFYLTYFDDFCEKIIFHDFFKAQKSHYDVKLQTQWLAK